MEHVDTKQLLDAEIERYEAIMQADDTISYIVFSRAYQLMRTIEALFIHISELAPRREEATADEVIQTLQDHGVLNEQMATALLELCDVNQYLFDVKNTDVDFVKQIVAYGDTYLQAIKVVREQVQNVNPVNQQVQNHGAEEE